MGDAVVRISPDDRLIEQLLLLKVHIGDIELKELQKRAHFFGKLRLSTVSAVDQPASGLTGTVLHEYLHDVDA